MLPRANIRIGAKSTFSCSLVPALVGVPSRRYLRNPSSIDPLTVPGQNLSDRYKRLEKSLRGKEALAQKLGDLGHPQQQERQTLLSTDGAISDSRVSSILAGEDKEEVFRGFRIPKEPKPPDSDECCMSGCAVCVYDLYEESMKAYNESLNEIRAALSEQNIPESTWPQSLRRIDEAEANGTPKRTQDVVRSAFEELERALAAKRQRASTS